MSEQIKILIVEDNRLLAETMRGFLAKKALLEIVAIAANSQEAIELLETVRPDVITLDLVMPQTDGFVLLDYLNKTAIEPAPKVIVLSAVSHETMIKRACDLGAIYYIVKPFSLEILYDRILDVMNTYRPDELISRSPSNTGSVDDYIKTIFLNVGIPTHLKGYRYLFEGVKMLAKDPDLYHNLTKELYPKVSQKFQTKPENVEGAIRNAIDIAWNSGKMTNMHALFGGTVYSDEKQSKPTNAEFISIVANNLPNINY